MQRLLLVLVAVALSATASPDEGIRYSSQNNSSTLAYTPDSYGSVDRTGTTDTLLPIQAALDAAAAAGGGEVYLRGGTYLVSNTLNVGTKVRLRGAGSGVTTIKNSGTTFAGKVISSAQVNAGIAMVGVDGAHVTDLTLDQSTLASGSNGLANGIVMVPTELDWSGTVTTNSSIERCRILKSINNTYAIWNFRGTGNKILHNSVDGGITTNDSGSQEGIEVFGGDDVLIDGNTITNVGNVGILIQSGAGSVSDSAVSNVRVVNNYVYACQVGIAITPGLDGGGTQQPMNNIVVANNQVVDSWSINIYANIFAATEVLNGLLIQGNTTTGSVISLKVSGAANTVLSGINISGNVFSGATTSSSGAVYLSTAYNVLFDSNVIRGNTNVAGVGLYAGALTNSTISNNRIENAQGPGMALVTGTDKVDIRGNTISNWDIAGAGSNGISMTSATNIAFQGNRFYNASFPNNCNIRAVSGVSGTRDLGSNVGSGINPFCGATLVPVISACGTGPAGALVSNWSTDDSGTLTVGGGVTACTLTFAATYPVARACSVTARTGTTPAYNTSTTAINLTTVVAGEVYDYVCR